MSEDISKEPSRRRRRPEPPDEDISREPTRRRRPRPPEDEPDNRGYDYEEAPPFPSLVKAAGLIWIIYGCLGLLNLVGQFLFVFVLAANTPGAGTGTLVVGGGFGLVIGGLIAAAFIFVGVQSVRGTAQDTLGNGVGSIILGVLAFGIVILEVAFGQFLAAGMVVVAAIMLLTAGVLTLVGREDYRLWKRALRDQLKREREARRARRRREDS
jgi:hypothetical protein